MNIKIIKGFVLLVWSPLTVQSQDVGFVHNGIPFTLFLKEVSYAYHSCIYLTKK